VCVVTARSSWVVFPRIFDAGEAGGQGYPRGLLGAPGPTGGSCFVSSSDGWVGKLIRLPLSFCSSGSFRSSWSVIHGDSNLPGTEASTELAGVV
jgi:hypothetical protein